MTWIGTDPSLPSICLNSHMDVVPVFPVSYDTYFLFKYEIKVYSCIKLARIKAHKLNFIINYTTLL
jgi:hypothetical protein